MLAYVSIYQATFCLSLIPSSISLSFYQFLYIFSLHLSFSLSVSFFLSFSLSSLLSLFLSVSVCLSIGITFPLFLSFSVCLYSSWCFCAPNYFQPPIASRTCSDQSQSLRFQPNQLREGLNDGPLTRALCLFGLISKKTYQLKSNTRC